MQKKRNTAVLPKMYSDLKPKQCSYMIKIIPKPNIGGNKTTKRLIVLAVLAIALVGMAGAANYMYEKASVKGVGYKNVEMIISTQYWLYAARSW